MLIGMARPRLDPSTLHDRYIGALVTSTLEGDLDVLATELELNRSEVTRAALTAYLDGEVTPV